MRRASSSSPEVEIGERELIGSTGAFIACTRIEKSTGRSRWHVYSKAGADFGGHWGRAAARQEAEELIRDRRI